jgi:hypothetical protein
MRYCLMTRILVALALATACSHGTPAPRTLAGTWSRDVGNGETQRLVLFESGMLGFQELGEKLPISRSYGRWSARGETIEFDVAGTEPAERMFPLAKRAATKLDGYTLMLDGVAWQAVDDPYGTSAGAAERAAKDERDWRYLVDRASQ